MDNLYFDTSANCDPLAHQSWEQANSVRKKVAFTITRIIQP